MTFIRKDIYLPFSVDQVFVYIAIPIEFVSKYLFTYFTDPVSPCSPSRPETAMFPSLRLLILELGALLPD
jgi:hypothetical protein